MYLHITSPIHTGTACMHKKFLFGERHGYRIGLELIRLSPVNMQETWIRDVSTTLVVFIEQEYLVEMSHIKVSCSMAKVRINSNAIKFLQQWEHGCAKHNMLTFALRFETLPRYVHAVPLAITQAKVEFPVLNTSFNWVLPTTCSFTLPRSFTSMPMRWSGSTSISVRTLEWTRVPRNTFSRVCAVVTVTASQLIRRRRRKGLLLDLMIEVNTSATVQLFCVDLAKSEPGNPPHAASSSLLKSSRLRSAAISIHSSATPPAIRINTGSRAANVWPARLPFTRFSLVPRSFLSGERSIPFSFPPPECWRSNQVALRKWRNTRE